MVVNEQGSEEQYHCWNNENCSDREGWRFQDPLIYDGHIQLSSTTNQKLLSDLNCRRVLETKAVPIHLGC